MNSKKRSCLRRWVALGAVATICCTSSASLAQTQVIHVKSNHTNSPGSGTPTDPYKYLRDALSPAYGDPQPGDIIKVHSANGTPYRPHAQASCGGDACNVNRNATFLIPVGVTVRGGSCCVGSAGWVAGILRPFRADGFI